MQGTLTTHPHTAAYYEEKCQEALRDSLRTAAEANALSQHTAAQLGQQSEQLHRIRDDVDAISHNLDTSQYLINGMKSWWGSMVQLFTNPPTAATPSTAVRLPNQPPLSGRVSPPAAPAHHPASADRFHASSAQSLVESRSATSSFPRARSSKPDFETELDQGLDELSGMLTELHSQAVEIGHALGSHNTMLDDIQVNVVRNSDRMAKQKTHLDAMLKRR